MKTTFTILAAGAALLTAGCAVDELSLGSSSREGKRLNGKRLNGKRLNGTGFSVTAAYPNPGSYQGVSLHGTSLKDAPVDDVALHATELSGLFDGSWISGTDFEGATLAGLDEGGTPLELYINRILPEASGLYVYDVWVLTRRGKEPLCVDDRGNRQVAIPIRGVWDHHQGNPGNGGKIPYSQKYGISFGCRDIGAIAKCVDAGYWPWLSKDHDLAHQSCVRMVRADYCGDGRSWTKNGTVIDIEDEIPEQLFSEYDPDVYQKQWVFEATWSPDGATCIENFRYDDYNPELGTSILREIKRGTCPNLPRNVYGKVAARFLGEIPAGEREGRSLCGWEQPRDCDPKVQACAGDQGLDYFGFTTVNAKGPGTW